MNGKDKKLWDFINKSEIKTVLLSVMASLATNAVVMLLLMLLLSLQ